MRAWSIGLQTRFSQKQRYIPMENVVYSFDPFFFYPCPPAPPTISCPASSSYLPLGLDYNSTQAGARDVASLKKIKGTSPCLLKHGRTTRYKSRKKIGGKRVNDTEKRTRLDSQNSFVLLIQIGEVFYRRMKLFKSGSIWGVYKNLSKNLKVGVWKSNLP